MKKSDTKNLLIRALLFALLLSVGGCNLFVDADKRVARARERIAANDYNAAIIELRNALQSKPDHVSAHLLLAGALLQTGDAAGAETELRQAIRGGAPASSTADLAARIQLALGKGRELLAQIDSGELPLPEPSRSAYRGQAFLGLQQLDSAVTAFKAALEADPKHVRAHIGLAQAWAAQGQTQDALAELDKAQALEQGNAEALMVRGMLLARRGDFEQAEQALTTARTGMQASLTRQQQAVLLAVLAETQLARGNLKDASATQKSLAGLTGDAPFTRVLGARVAIAQQDYAAASADLQRVVAASPDMVSARFLLGAALLAQGNLNQAEAQLAQVIQSSPDNLEARKLLAQVRLRLNQPDAAMQVLMPADQPGESDPQVSTMMGLAHLRLGDDAGALDAFQRGAAKQPNNRQLQLNLAEVYYRTRQIAKAIEVLNALPVVETDTRREGMLISALAVRGTKAAQAQLDTLVSEHPKHLGILNLASLFYAGSGEYERARALIGQAYAVKPDDPTTLFNAARVEVAAGNPTAATGRLEKLLSVDPNNSMAAIGLAEIAVRTGDFASAQKRLAEFSRRDPKAIEPIMLLARIYLQQKRADDADKLIKDTIAANPKRADVLNAAGLLYLDAGRYDQAAARLREATDADGRNPLYWFNLARVRLALDQPVAAREALEKSLQQRPDAIATVGALSMLDLREGKRDAATARLGDLKKKHPDDPDVVVLEGDLNMAMGQYQQAADLFAKAATLRDSASVALKTYRALQLGKLGNSQAPLERWLGKHPEDQSVRAVLAETYAQSGQPKKAIEQYELLTRMGKPNATVMNNLAYLYQETKDLRAEETARKAYELAPGAPAVADTYGWILLQVGKNEASLKILETAAKASPDPEIGYHYAAALARSGDHGAAREKLGALLSQSKTFASQADARRLLQELPQ